MGFLCLIRLFWKWRWGSRIPVRVWLGVAKWRRIATDRNRLLLRRVRSYGAKHHRGVSVLHQRVISSSERLRVSGMNCATSQTSMKQNRA